MVGCTTIASDKFMKMSIHGFIIYLISEPKTWQLQPVFACLILCWPWPQTNKLLAWGWGLHHRSFRSGSSICRVHKHAFQVRLPLHANQSHISFVSPCFGSQTQSWNRSRSQRWPGVLWRCATFHADLVPIDDLRFLDGLCTAYDRGSTLDRRTQFDEVWLSNCREVFNVPTRPCPSNTTLRIVHDQSKNIMTK